jgi:hypothetical protein
MAFDTSTHVVERGDVHRVQSRTDADLIPATP